MIVSKATTEYTSDKRNYLSVTNKADSDHVVFRYGVSETTFLKKDLSAVLEMLVFARDELK